VNQYDLHIKALELAVTTTHDAETTQEVITRAGKYAEFPRSGPKNSMQVLPNTEHGQNRGNDGAP
jgi:hypothetical protein